MQAYLGIHLILAQWAILCGSLQYSVVIATYYGIRIASRKTATAHFANHPALKMKVKYYIDT